MREAKVMIIVGDDITGFDLANMEKFSLKLKNGTLQIIAVEKHLETINLKKVNLLPPPTESPTITRAPHTKDIKHRSLNTDKLTYDNFEKLFEQYVHLQEQGEKGTIMSLFKEWEGKTKVHHKTLHVWISQAKKCLSGNKKACSSLNSWIRDFCDQYKYNHKEEFK